jgi:DNA-binding transcriptional ArsR family regulator
VPVLVRSGASGVLNSKATVGNDEWGVLEEHVKAVRSDDPRRFLELHQRDAVLLGSLWRRLGDADQKIQRSINHYVLRWIDEGGPHPDTQPQRPIGGDLFELKQWRNDRSGHAELLDWNHPTIAGLRGTWASVLEQFLASTRRGGPLELTDLVAPTSAPQRPPATLLPPAPYTVSSALRTPSMLDLATGNYLGARLGLDSLFRETAEKERANREAEERMSLVLEHRQRLEDENAEQVRLLREIRDGLSRAVTPPPIHGTHEAGRRGPTRPPGQTRKPHRDVLGQQQRTRLRRLAILKALPATDIGNILQQLDEFGDDGQDPSTISKDLTAMRSSGAVHRTKLDRTGKGDAIVASVNE